LARPSRQWFLVNDLSAFRFKSKTKSNTKTVNKSSKDIKPKSTYHAGSYLKNILGVLMLMQVLLLAPLAMLPFFNQNSSNQYDLPGWVCILVLFTMIALIILRKVRTDRRRRMLESELLSIHSCSIVWQAVVLSHYSALKKTKGTFRNYTQYLSAEAKSLRKCAFFIHDWVARKSEELSVDLGGFVIDGKCPIT